MKYSIVMVTGVLLLSFLGCSEHKEVEPKKSLHIAKKSKVKKSSSKIKNNHKKITNDYKSTIDKNITMSKSKQKKLAALKAKREKLLNEMKLLQAEYPTSKNKTALNQKRAKITKELNRIQKEYEALESKVVVVNYVEKKNKTKE
jgi:hypothetical protein